MCNCVELGPRPLAATYNCKACWSRISGPNALVTFGTGEAPRTTAHSSPFYTCNFLDAAWILYNTEAKGTRWTQPEGVLYVGSERSF